MRPKFYARADEVDLDSIKGKLTCRECGKARLPTPSGLCCSDGHGRIVPLCVKERQAVPLAVLPKATLVPGAVRLYTIAGEDGIWKRIRLDPLRPPSRRIDPETKTNAGLVARVERKGIWRAFLFGPHDTAPDAARSTRGKRYGDAQSV